MRCGSCGHENPVLHRYCGGCGAALAAGINTEQAQAEELTSTQSPVQTAHPPRSAAASEISVDAIRTKLNPPRRELEDSVSHPSDLSLFRSFRESESIDDDEWENAGPRRRLYLGLVLAVLIAGAIYMAWRSGQLSTAHARQVQPAPAGETSENSASKSFDTQGNNQPKSPQNTAKTDPLPAEMRPVTKPSPDSVGHEQPVQKVSNVVSPAPSASIDNGSEDLAMAQHYLSGANGKRDSTEAAKWLWKSISKHNGEATILLADLYLKGDGVSKNCDQARVLLDTAGRKGVAGAGERLRNLQAFGCQ